MVMAKQQSSLKLFLLSDVAAASNVVKFPDIKGPNPSCQHSPLSFLPVREVIVTC